MTHAKIRHLKKGNAESEKMASDEKKYCVHVSVHGGHGGPPIDCCKSSLESFVCLGVCKTGRGGVKHMIVKRERYYGSDLSIRKVRTYFTGYLSALSSRPNTFAKGRREGD